MQYSKSLSDLCFRNLIAVYARETPDAVALAAPGWAGVSYAELAEQICTARAALHTLGLGRQHRIALVLPNGPELAALFLTLSASAVCAPLNPAYRPREFEYFLRNLRADALLVRKGDDSPAIAVAEALGLPVLELAARRDAGGSLFSWLGETKYPPISDEETQSDDLALLLYTSGTTAEPKLVPLTHRNLFNAAVQICAATELTAQDRCLNVMPLFHIHGLSTVLASVIVGASVVCLPAFSADAFYEGLEKFKPTWYTAAPTIHQAILERAPRERERVENHSLRFVRSASAPMPPQVIREMERVFKVPFIEAYGMTETAPQISSNPLPPRPRKPGSVGLAAGPELGIMDEEGRLLPAGETGEVVVRGANVMRGYENNPVANAAAFRDGWFRTGDRGYLDAEGYLYVTGRIKEIINRGGEKIAPREVEQVLLEHPAVARAVTFAVPHARLGEDVAAMVVLRAGQTVTAAELRRFCAQELAAFKVPRTVLMVDEIPQGHTAKVQRARLAARTGLVKPALESNGQAAAPEPHPVIQEMLMEWWSEVLRVEGVSVDADFFQLGGDSLNAASIAARIRDAFQLEMPLSTFFDAPTIEGMADWIAVHSREVTAEPTPAIQAQERTGELPLTFAQDGLWFLDQLTGGNPAYHLCRALELRGPLDIRALEQSLNQLVQRHEALRTRFPARDGQPYQLIAPTAQIALPAIDLSALPAAKRHARAQELAGAEARRPFQLDKDLMLRALLLHLAAAEHVLVLTTHHIATDGASFSILLRELGTLYGAYAAGEPAAFVVAALPKLPFQFADYAVWQRGRAEDAESARLLAYWQEQLRGIPSELRLPFDRPRKPVQTFRGARTWFQVSRETADALRGASRIEGVTLYMSLLTAFAVLLYRYTGQTDIVIGSPHANRAQDGLENVVGFISNTLVMRVRLEGNPTFREALRRVRAMVLEADAHSGMPFERLVKALRPRRQLDRTPLFQVNFRAQEEGLTCPELRGIAVQPVELDPQTAKFDLALELWGGEGIHGFFEYNTDLFDAATIERLVLDWQELTTFLACAPDTPIASPLLATGFEQTRKAHMAADNQEKLPIKSLGSAKRQHVKLN